jgi:hypothetical protein
MLRSSSRRLRLDGSSRRPRRHRGGVRFPLPVVRPAPTPIGIAAKNDGVSKSIEVRRATAVHSSAWVETDAVALTLTKDEAEA